MTLEQIAWRGTHVEKPNDDRIVLVWMPASKTYPVWLGYLNSAGDWIAPDACKLACEVVAWAELPRGAA